MRRKGELTIREVAKRLECHEDTVRAWCRSAVDGGWTRLRAVRRDVAGRYWIGEADVASLLSATEAPLGKGFMLIPTEVPFR
jgi:transposase